MHIAITILGAPPTFLAAKLSKTLRQIVILWPDYKHHYHLEEVSSCSVKCEVDHRPGTCFSKATFGTPLTHLCLPTINLVPLLLRFEHRGIRGNGTAWLHED